MRGGLLRFAKFTGRASRAEFAIVFGICLALGLITLALQNDLPKSAWRDGTVIVLSVVQWWLPLAASVRRMHDLNKSGWLLPLFIVPIVGIVFLAWWFFRPGADPNRYGAATPLMTKASAG